MSFNVLRVFVAIIVVGFLGLQPSQTYINGLSLDFFIFRQVGGKLVWICEHMHDHLIAHQLVFFLSAKKLCSNCRKQTVSVSFNFFHLLIKFLFITAPLVF